MSSSFAGCEAVDAAFLLRFLRVLFRSPTPDGNGSVRRRFLGLLRRLVLADAGRGAAKIGAIDAVRFGERIVNAERVVRSDNSELPDRTDTERLREPEAGKRDELPIRLRGLSTDHGD